MWPRGRSTIGYWFRRALCENVCCTCVCRYLSMSVFVCVLRNKVASEN